MEVLWTLAHPPCQKGPEEERAWGWLQKIGLPLEQRPQEARKEAVAGKGAATRCGPSCLGSGA